LTPRAVKIAFLREDIAFTIPAVLEIEAPDVIVLAATGKHDEYVEQILKFHIPPFPVLRTGHVEMTSEQMTQYVAQQLYLK